MFTATVLSNPSTKSSAGKKQKNIPSKPPLLLSPLPMGNYDFGATYESLECEELPHYSYPLPSPPDTNGSSVNNYTYISAGTPTDRRSSKNYVYALEEDLYHVIGPNAGLQPASGKNQSGHVSPPPVPKRNGDNGFHLGGLYHVLEGGLTNGIPQARLAAQYEDPTATKFRVNDLLNYSYSFFA